MDYAPLISAGDAVAVHAGGDAVFMDASYHLSTSGRDAHAEFMDARIDGAVFFDINKITDSESPLPHTMPDAAVFEKHMRGLGLCNGDAVVVYDASDFYSSARAWFMLRYFGHANVRLLDGGFNAWKKAGGKIASGAAQDMPQGDFTAQRSPDYPDIVMLDEMRDVIGGDGAAYQVLDARAAARFTGEAPEPRAGLASGHMPGAVNYPIGSLIDKETGKFLDRDSLRKKFARVNRDKPIITTCGSGVTACGLTLALEIAGIKPVRVYDGSWSEWAGSDGCPIATGAE